MNGRLPPALAADLDALGLGPPGFTPPPEVAQAAQQGLALRARHGRGGTEVGLARAQALAAGQPQSSREMRVIAGWFARFAGLRAREGWGDAAAPSTGYIAWQLWGGDAGRAWVERHRPDWG
ncbi:hypothetical protein [Paracoccus alkenifer]|uniref:Uncharacterized protein n=1 Tax=Paracoccus alkenifer TaxID=65735 RepID=A0A1H6LLB2_9RHOB|nr:hypothetical protein [Paracoccus alkenifer]SEH86183.1 hypothetical protein SAMN04488075_1488 [Paracoccus alkenifer]